jgi:TolB-like protein/Tfp pilus assembly protein PilF
MTLAVGVLAVVGYFVWRSVAKNPLESAKSIAVLPFANTSTSKTDDSLSDGLTDELINALQAVKGLRVQGRISSFFFKDKKETPQRLGEQLQVDHLLTGSVSRDGNRMRINVDLALAATGFSLWSDTYNRELSDLFAVRAEVARQVTRALKVQLGVDAARNIAQKPTQSLEAYQLFLTGRFHWNQYSEKGFLKSIELYEEALKHDPKYARAYSGLADAYTQLAIDWRPPKEQFRKAKVAAQQALKLDDKLAEAWVSLGTIQIFHTWEWAEAEASFKRAIECNPAYPDSYHFYGHYLEVIGKPDEAVTMMQKGLERDPYSDIIAGEIGGAYYHARRYDEAIEQCKRAIKMNVETPLAYLYMAQAWNQKGDAKQAIEVVKKGLATLPDPHPELIAEWAYSLARGGQPEEARHKLQELRAMGAAKGFQDEFLPIAIFAALGETDLALAALEKSCEEPSVLLYLINTEAELDPLRNHPRFHAVLRKMNLAK